MRKSVYIHIPFCKKICSYCDFCKMFYDEKLADRYLKALEKEIQQRYLGDELKTIYIGGGTPSALSVSQLEKLLSITDQFRLEEKYEFSIECNIEDIEEEKLSVLAKHGVNRLSIGVQTINSQFLKVLNRQYSREEVMMRINLAKEKFSNISIDFMYGFAGEKNSDLEEDLNFFLSMDLPHISLYSLMIEPHTKLFLANYSPLEDDQQSSMYQIILSHLKKWGYQQYEISNFSKRGFESQHNLVYWNNEHYYGFGLGASGYLEEVRYQNTKSINHYLEGKWVCEEEVVDLQKAMEYEMICGLRKREGISRKKFYQKFEKKVEEVFPIDYLLQHQLLEKNGDYLAIPKDKIYISNTILINFIS